tara:strand:- start:322 stop:588 length:267 start_codon:yes stop_codon:yes gene_type:complete
MSSFEAHSMDGIQKWSHWLLVFSLLSTATISGLGVNLANKSDEDDGTAQGEKWIFVATLSVSVILIAVLLIVAYRHRATIKEHIKQKL